MAFHLPFLPEGGRENKFPDSRGLSPIPSPYQTFPTTCSTFPFLVQTRWWGSGLFGVDEQVPYHR